MRLRDDTIVNVPNIAGPRLSGEAQVLAGYEEIGKNSAAIAQVLVGEGRVVQVAVHPELPTNDATSQADRNRVFDETFDF